MELVVDGAVLLGIGVVAPLALGGWRRWLPAAGAAGAALALAPGWPSGMLAVPAVGYLRGLQRFVEERAPG